MARAMHARPDRQRLLIVWARFGILRLLAQQLSHIILALRNIRIIGIEDAPPDRQRLLVAHARLLQVADRAIPFRQVVQHFATKLGVQRATVFKNRPRALQIWNTARQIAGYFQHKWKRVAQPRRQLIGASKRGIG